MRDRNRGPVASTNDASSAIQLLPRSTSAFAACHDDSHLSIIQRQLSSIRSDSYRSHMLLTSVRSSLSCLGKFAPRNAGHSRKWILPHLLSARFPAAVQPHPTLFISISNTIRCIDADLFIPAGLLYRSGRYSAAIRYLTWPHVSLACN
jgi:hypothetical protein